jgi:uncharacterized protein (TIGR03032 family)
MLARTNTAGGWRAHKRDGGVVWDLSANGPIVEGLSMPHSPRLHGGKTWFLESGVGSISVLERPGAKPTEVARVPGFTRGLCFVGKYAFVGLSQIRESAIFGGIPIAESTRTRACGVWVVDTTTGKIEAFLRFEGAVQEIFAIEPLIGLRWPTMINEPGEVLDSSFVVPTQHLPKSV